jgi:hypothetical protein
MRGTKRSRVGVVGAVAALAAMSMMTSAAAGTASCSRAAANAAIAHVKPRIPSLASGTMVVTPGMADELICSDFTGDGLVDLAVTVASGGTAGDIGWVVLQRTSIGWRVALTHGGYKVGLYLVGHDLADSQPVYRKSDPNCCPTGGFDHQRWHWSGRRFVVVRSWHDKSYRP